jgi:hypothetical protein
MSRLYGWLWTEESERGQGTIEYVLVMLAVAAVAAVLISWAKGGSGKNVLGDLFEDVIGWVTGAARSFRL